MDLEQHFLKISVALGKRRHDFMLVGVDQNDLEREALRVGEKVMSKPHSIA